MQIIRGGADGRSHATDPETAYAFVLWLGHGWPWHVCHYSSTEAVRNPVNLNFRNPVHAASSSAFGLRFFALQSNAQTNAKLFIFAFEHVANCALRMRASTTAVGSRTSPLSSNVLFPPDKPITWLCKVAPGCTMLHGYMAFRDEP